MHKTFLHAMICLWSVAMFSCVSDPPPPPVEEEIQATALAGIDYSESFTASFQNTLNGYYALKDAFVKADADAVKSNASALQEKLKTFTLDEVEAIDSVAHQTLLTVPTQIQSSLDAIVKEKDLEKQRVLFEQISQAMYKLLQTLKPSGVKAYNQFCPMAFGDKGAYWLSEADSIMNPYFGKKMLHCGEVKEVLFFQ